MREDICSETQTLHLVTTDTFHAQYRVLEAFSIINLILGEETRFGFEIVKEHALMMTFRFSLGFPAIFIIFGGSGAPKRIQEGLAVSSTYLSMVRQRVQVWPIHAQFAQ